MVVVSGSSTGGAGRGRFENLRKRVLFDREGTAFMEETCDMCLYSETRQRDKGWRDAVRLFPSEAMWRQSDLYTHTNIRVSEMERRTQPCLWTTDDLGKMVATENNHLLARRTPLYTGPPHTRASCCPQSARQSLRCTNAFDPALTSPFQVVATGVPPILFTATASLFQSTWYVEGRQKDRHGSCHPNV